MFRHIASSGSRARIAFAATAASLALTGVLATPASAQSPLDNVLGCQAPGGQQTTGALLGAVLGAVAGNSMGKGDAGATAIGALVGGAGGSWMGCKIQRDREDARYAGYTTARQQLTRSPAAYRRAVADQRRRDQDEADRRYWQARYDEDRYDSDRRYGDDRSYGRYGY